MSRSLSFSRQPAVHQCLKGANTVQSGHQVKQAPRLYSAPCKNLTSRVSTLGQTSLVPFRNGACPLPASNRGSLLSPSLKMTVSRRATHFKVDNSKYKKAKVDTSKNKGAQIAYPWGTNAGRDVWKIRGGSALVLAAAFGGAFVYCENRTEGEFCSKFREYLGLKKN